MSIEAPPNQNEAAAVNAVNRAALVMVTSLFFLWGFLTVLNDVLVPHFRSVFTLNYTQAMLIQFSFFLGYVVTALPSGWVVSRVGYKTSMVIALVVMGAGALLFLPAADLASYPLFLAALFVLASGITLLQVSCNPYVSVLGPPQTASSRLNLAQAFNSLGAAIAPWLGGMLIFTIAQHRLQNAPSFTSQQQTAWRLAEVSSVKVPYLIFACVLFASAAIVWRFRLPVVASAGHEGAEVVVNGRAATSAWQVRHLVLGALGIMLYCGAEVSIGSFIINFLAQPDIGGMSPLRAARFASYYWTAAMVGRFAGSALLRRIRPGQLLGICAVGASLLVFITLISTGAVAVWSIVFVGLFNSIMFPTIFTLGIDGMGKFTSQASGILFLGVVGSATLPVVQGALADRVGIHAAFILPALYYLYVVYYGFRGSRHS
jgi:FHS family L-fucose permease-like MFS transporter